LNHWSICSASGVRDDSRAAAEERNSEEGRPGPPETARAEPIEGRGERLSRFAENDPRPSATPDVETWRGWLRPGEVGFWPKAPNPRAAPALPDVEGGPRD
jgi:hypothetical protein